MTRKCSWCDPVRLGILVVMVLLAILVACAVSAHSERVAVAPAFLFVAVDDASRDKWGNGAIDRGIHAEAIQNAKSSGARAVVMKFFFDRPSQSQSDAALAVAIGSMPVFLQYSLGGNSSDASVPRAWRDDLASPSLQGALKGYPTMAPLPALAQHAAGVGFVDVRDDTAQDRIEMVGHDTGHTVASLPLLTLEAATGQRAVIAGSMLRLGSHVYPLSSDGRIECPYLTIGHADVLPLQALVAGQIPADKIRDRVVVIGYLRADSPQYPVSWLRSLPIHEVFFRQIACLGQLFPT